MTDPWDARNTGAMGLAGGGRGSDVAQVPPCHLTRGGDRLKLAIPLLGHYGIPLHDEIELGKQL